MAATTTTTVTASGSVQEMLRKFEATRLVEAAGSAARPRAAVSRRSSSVRTAAPAHVKLRHRSSESRIGLHRSRPVSTHVSPLLRERPPVLKRNAALKARVSDRVREMEQRKSAENGGAEHGDGDDISGEKSPKLEQSSDARPRRSVEYSTVAELMRTRKNSGGEAAVSSSPETTKVGRQPVRRPAASGTSPTSAGKRVWRRPQVTRHKPLVRIVANEHKNNALKSDDASVSKGTIPAASTVAVSGDKLEDMSSLPLPVGPPPPKPPRTFEHDAYVAARQPASLTASPVSQAGAAGVGSLTDSDLAVPHATTSVAIRRSTSATKPSLARKPSDLCALRNSSFLETFIARTPSTARPTSSEHVYAEPSVVRARNPPRPLTPPPPPPPERRRHGDAPAPYAVSNPLRRSASDETLYGTLSRQHVYECVKDTKRPTSVSSSSSSPPSLQRHPAFKRLERPSLKRSAPHPGQPPPPVASRLLREAGDVMGCRLGGVAEGEATSEQKNSRSGWCAGALAAKRRNYLRRVTSRMSCRRVQPSPVPEADRLYDTLLVVALSADAEGKLEPCILSKSPLDAALEADVAPFCFPDAARWQRSPDQWGRSCADGGAAYTLVVTDQRGARRYGYCRRLTADTEEGVVTLPIAYCLLSRHCATAFYSRLLSVIMEHHGTSEQHRLAMLEDLRNQRFPPPGGSVTVAPPETGAEAGSEQERANSLTQCIPGARPQPVEVRRPLDARLEEEGLYQLVRRLGVDLFIQLFSSALLERKIILHSQHLSVLSASVSALQAALSPFSWQHVLVPVVPAHLAEVLAAPSPLIVGALPDTRPAQHDNQPDDAICVDLDAVLLVQCMGDESTILPRKLGRALAEALRLAAWLPGAEPHPASAAVLLAEMLLRMFVEVCGHYRDHLVTQQDGKTVFQRDSFVDAAPSDEVKEFLSWFTETAMFNAFVESCEQHTEGPEVRLFDRRILERHPDLESSIQSLLKSTRQLGKPAPSWFKWRLNT